MNSKVTIEKPVNKVINGEKFTLKPGSEYEVTRETKQCLELIIFGEKVLINKKSLDMSGWSRTQGKQVKSNSNLKTERKMGTKTSETAKAAKESKAKAKTAKTAKETKESKAKAKTSETAKESKAKKEKKGPGVIASIHEFIVEKGPIKESAILKALVKRFPNRTEDSMSKTIKAQIGTKKQPTRMEREKGITFNITTDEKTNERTYALAKK